MEPKRLSLGLLVVGLALLAVPSVRQGLGEIVTVVGPTSLQAWEEPVLRRAISAAPDDARVWLGVAELRAFRLGVEDAQGTPVSPTDAQSVIQAYERAIELDSGSPTARLRLALFHLADSGSLARTSAGGQYVRETTRTYDQQRSLRAAEPLLRHVRATAPDDAVGDCLLALCLFAAQRDDEAHAALAEARRKTLWSTHQREAALAACRVAALAGIPRVSRSQSAMVVGDATLSSHLRDVARLLVSEADDRRLRGDHEGAIARFGAVAHLGSFVRQNAYDALGGLVGIAISHMASGPFAERQGVQDKEQLVRARVAGFTSYLRAHGHASEADWYEADMQAAQVWNADAHRYGDLMMSHYMDELARAGTFQAVAFATTAASVLGLIFLAGLVSLALRYWREPRADPAFGHGGWVLLLLLAVVPGQVAAFVGPRVTAPGSMLTVAGAVLVVVSIAGALAWAVVAGIVAARRRQAGRPAFRTALAGLRQLALPTLVALLVLGLVLAPIVHHGLVRLDQDQMRVVEQGEVQYWGIGTGHVAPGARTASPQRSP